MADDLVQAPKVQTLAKPSAVSLLEARQHVQRSPEIALAFGQALADGWSADELADTLTFLLQQDMEEDVEAVWQTALYLSDEFIQMGGSMMAVSTETGQAITRIPEEAIYQPALVPREGGGMAVPLPRIDPKLEGAIVQHEHEKGREAATTAAILEHLPQSDLLRQEGDNRLLVTTRAGRKQIVGRLRDALPTLLPDNCSGSSQQFFSLFEFKDELPVNLRLIDGEAVARIQTPVQDARTMNLRHDPYNASLARIAAQWAREMARMLAVTAHSVLKVQTASVEEAQRAPTWPSGYTYWVSDPNTARELMTSGLVVPDAPTVLLRGPLGVIVLDSESFVCEGRERLDKWDIGATVKFTLCIDWEKVLAFQLSDIPISGVSIA